VLFTQCEQRTCSRPEGGYIHQSCALSRALLLVAGPCCLVATGVTWDDHHMIAMWRGLAAILMGVVKLI
jgi:hypothetical protein